MTYCKGYLKAGLRLRDKVYLQNALYLVCFIAEAVQFDFYQ